MSAFSCSRMYLAIVASFRPTVDTQQPAYQSFRLPNLYFMFACRSKIISELLPFR